MRVVASIAPLRSLETPIALATKELEWHAWGEDLFMGNCLTLLGSSAAFDSTIIGDNVCKGANCGDGVTAVYHPFKSKEKWFACYEQALAAHR